MFNIKLGDRVGYWLDINQYIAPPSAALSSRIKKEDTVLGLEIRDGQTAFILVHAKANPLTADMLKMWRTLTCLEFSPEIDSHIGECFDWVRVSYVSLVGSSAPMTLVKQEKPCGFCQRKNDLGITICWYCGNNP